MKNSSFDKFPYVCVPRDFAKNTNISLQTKGFLVFLLSYPHESLVNLKAIGKELNYSEEFIENITEELTLHGYIKQKEDGSYLLSLLNE